MTASAKSLSLSPDQEASIRKELAAILEGASFSGSERCREFLEFVVKHFLAGDYELLNERFLGVQLFGKQVDYETATDSVVRVRATDVRHRLARHYSVSPSISGVSIGLASGSYIPEFRWSDPSAQPAPKADSAPNAELPPHPVSAHPGWLVPGGFAAGLIILALSITCVVQWLQLRSIEQSLYAWKALPAVSGLWSGFLDDKRGTDIVFADSSYSLIQALSNQPLSLSDYLSHNYTGHLQHLSADRLEDIREISGWSLGSSVEFELVPRLMAMDPLGKHFHLYSARKYMPDLIRRNNVILLGSHFGNPWDTLFESRMNFKFEFGSPYKITNRAPKPGEQQIYTWTGSDGYGVVAFLPNQEGTGNVLLIEGTSSEATQAAGDFLLSQEQLTDLQNRLHLNKLPYFEVLLKTSQVKGTPLTATIEAVRTYPNRN